MLVLFPYWGWQATFVVLQNLSTFNPFPEGFSQVSLSADLEKNLTGVRDQNPFGKLPTMYFIESQSGWVGIDFKAIQFQTPAFL